MSRVNKSSDQPLGGSQSELTPVVQHTYNTNRNVACNFHFWSFSNIRKHHTIQQLQQSYNFLNKCKKIEVKLNCILSQDNCHFLSAIASSGVWHVKKLTTICKWQMKIICIKIRKDTDCPMVAGSCRSRFWSTFKVRSLRRWPVARHIS